MNLYICFYKNKKIDVIAPTSYAAQQKAAALFKAKKSYDVTVMLTAIDNAPVIHAPTF